MMQQGRRQAPVVVLNTMQKREHGREAQLGNIAAAKVRSFFGWAGEGCEAHIAIVL